MQDRYEILDDNGVIHSGSEDEMRRAFEVMTNDDGNSDFEEDEIERWFLQSWDGDLKLVQVIQTYK